MSEAETVARTPTPRTRATLAADLRNLGVQEGDILLVHAAMSKVGWIAGGPVALIQALQDALTPAGTLVMPAHSADHSDPEMWSNPPVPEAWKPIIRAEAPAFDPRLTPTRGVGRMAELFRTWPDVRRSNHPNMSFAAWGRHADVITADHSLSFGFGDQSPLGRIYELDGCVLLLGVGHGRNTSLHLAETRAGVVGSISMGAPVLVDGERRWQTYDEIDFNDEVFPELGADLERETTAVTIGKVGSAESRLFSQRTAVDFARQWLLEHQKKSDTE